MKNDFVFCYVYLIPIPSDSFETCSQHYKSIKESQDIW